MNRNRNRQKMLLATVSSRTVLPLALNRYWLCIHSPMSTMVCFITFKLTPSKEDPLPPLFE